MIMRYFLLHFRQDCTSNFELEMSTGDGALERPNTFSIMLEMPCLVTGFYRYMKMPAFKASLRTSSLS